MGGTVPNHVAMLIYGIYVLKYYLYGLDCNQIRAKVFPELTEFKIRSYIEIKVMVGAHIACIVIYFTSKLLSKKNDYVSYFKTFMITFRILIFFFAFMRIILGDL